MALKIRRRKDERTGSAPETGMTLVEHLTELRNRLVISILAIALGAIVGFILYEPILRFLQEPLCGAIKDGRSCRLFVTDPLEPFLIRLKIAAYSGLALASPIVFYQIWRFITPGLNPNEKRYAVPFVLSSVTLFALGGAVAMITFPKALQFLISIGGESLETIFSPNRYLRLILLMIVAFGIAFEFPVLLVFLMLSGAISSRQLQGWWRPAVVIIFAVAAVITPSQDPYSLAFMAVPMCLFYAGSILLGRLLGK